MPIIEVKHLTKEYDLGAVTSLKDTVRHTCARLTGKPTWQRERFKALDDIDFTVEEGEVVGIIGHNGAGKSTLLKHLANVTKPTHGEVVVRGSVAPLIEVGAGVNPELTGRENIFLNGAILGIPKKVIQQKLDEIIDFSELEKFIDTPVKRYSSGMTVKLGFSIATSMNADILIIDEVLAVGDLAFQRKCFNRMEHLITKQNKTVLLVSHNIRQVERMCSRVLLLNKGAVEVDDLPSKVCNIFYQQSNEIIQRQSKDSSLESARIQSSGEVENINIQIYDQDGLEVSELVSGDPLHVKVTFTLNKAYDDLRIFVGTHRTDFIYLTVSGTSEYTDKLAYGTGENTVEYKLNSFPLASGTYCVRLAIFDGFERALFNGESLLIFTVKSNQEGTLNDKWKTLNLPGGMVINGKEYRSKRQTEGH
tara:strand:- start:10960 stop:12222 length:1263 start_codon:yes stop_codon:yes gene_type:complete